MEKILKWRRWYRKGGGAGDERKIEVEDVVEERGRCRRGRR